MTLQKMGGIAALLLMVAYVVGLGLNFTLLDSSSIVKPIDQVAFLVDKQIIMHVWILFIYIAFGVFLVFLALALFEQVKVDASALAQLATAFGLIWAGLLIASGNVYIIGLGKIVDLYGKDPVQAASLWQAINAIHEGLSGASELPGGLWTLLVSLAALQAKKFPRVLNYFGIGIGAAGILSVIPPLFTGGVAVFALGQIVWWAWLGILLLRRNLRVAA